MSVSAVNVFLDDYDSRRPVIEIVAVNVAVLSLDDSQRTRNEYLLGDDAMQVSESDINTVDLVVIPKADAKERILSYVQTHIGCRTSDVIYNLGLDPDLVLDCLRELESENRVMGKAIDRE